ncbi:hypothetical protein OIU85_012310 [Salix viminalis]|uniref:Uncharacterized protein n=1 Tax=Salix viminalis TaxID=40686 RepID=A0A9Q0NP06_SALVM|nr:hypothetical protein OIU85_012310 [Salix viminalis]
MHHACGDIFCLRIAALILYYKASGNLFLSVSSAAKTHPKRLKLSGSYRRGVFQFQNDKQLILWIGVRVGHDFGCGGGPDKNYRNPARKYCMSLAHLPLS